MKTDRLLVISSLISIVFSTFHFASDVLRARAGNNEQGGSTLIAMPLIVIWLYGATVLAGRRSGNIIMLLAGVGAVGLALLHVMPSTGMFTGVLPRGAGGDFIFVWGLHVLVVSGMYSVILALRALFAADSQ